MSRTRTLGLAIGLGLASLAIPAGAAPVPFTATLAIQVGSLGQVVATGSGTGTSTGVGGTASIPAGVFSIALTTSVSPPLLVIDGFGLGAPGLSGTGSLPLAPGSNTALSWNGATGTMGLDLSGYLITGFAGPTPNVQPGIPLAVVGVGGTQKVSYLGGLIMFTVLANPYQLGMVTVMGALQGVPSTVMGTGFDNRTAGGAGVLQLVSPTVISAGALGSIPALTTTHLPRPGAGHARARRRRPRTARRAAARLHGSVTGP